MTVGNLNGLEVGMAVSGQGLPGGVRIRGIDPTTNTLTLSNAANAGVTAPYSFRRTGSLVESSIAGMLAPDTTAHSTDFSSIRSGAVVTVVGGTLRTADTRTVPGTGGSIPYFIEDTAVTNTKFFNATTTTVVNITSTTLTLQNALRGTYTDAINVVFQIEGVNYGPFNMNGGSTTATFVSNFANETFTLSAPALKTSSATWLKFGDQSYGPFELTKNSLIARWIGARSLQVGMPVAGTGIPTGSVIMAVNTAAEDTNRFNISLSAKATVGGTQRLTIAGGPLKAFTKLDRDFWVKDSLEKISIESGWLLYRSNDPFSNIFGAGYGKGQVGTRYWITNYNLLGRITWFGGEGLYGFDVLPDPTGNVLFTSGEQFVTDRLDAFSTLDTSVSSGKQGFVEDSPSDFYEPGKLVRLDVFVGNVVPTRIDWFLNGEPVVGNNPVVEEAVYTYTEGTTNPVTVTVPSRRWYRSALTLNSLTSAETGFYYVRAVGLDSSLYSVSNLMQVTIPDQFPQFVSDPESRVVRKTGSSVTVSAELKYNAKAILDTPRAVVSAKDGNMYFLDYENAAVRSLSPGGFVSTMIGGGKTSVAMESKQAPVDSIWGLAKNTILSAGSFNTDSNLIFLSGGTGGLTVGMQVVSASNNSDIVFKNTAAIRVERIVNAYTVEVSQRPEVKAENHPLIFQAPVGTTPASTADVVYARASTIFASYRVTVPSDSGNNLIANIQPGMMVTGYGVKDYTKVVAVEPESNTVVLSSFINHIGAESDNLLTFVRPLSKPEGMAVDEVGALYIADTANNRIIRFYPKEVYDLRRGFVPELKKGTIEIIKSGSVSGELALSRPTGISVQGYGNKAEIYVANAGNHNVLKIYYDTQTQSWVNKLVAGSRLGQWGGTDGIGESARFSGPRDVAYDNGSLYVADYLNHTIRRIDRIQEIGVDPVVTTVAGSRGQAGLIDGVNQSARLYFPAGLAVDTADGSVVFSDMGNHAIRRLKSNGAVATLAGVVTNGMPNESKEDGIGTSAGFWYPKGVAVDAKGHIFVADTSNHTIRKISPGLVVSTVAGVPRFFHFRDTERDWYNPDRFVPREFELNWYKDGLVVKNGFQSNNSYVSGADTNELRIENLSSEDSGAYALRAVSLTRKPSESAVAQVVVTQDSGPDFVGSLALTPGSLKAAELNLRDLLPTTPTESFVLDSVRWDPNFEAEKPFWLDLISRNLPTPLEGKKIQLVAAGVHHSMVYTQDGQLFAWGDNDYGQLGVGDMDARFAPVLVRLDDLGGRTISMIALGEHHSVVMTTDGKVYAWGRNDFGQLGTSSRQNSTTPKLVSFSGMEPLRSIACGYHHTLAMRFDGTLYSWGLNNYRQLGRTPIPASVTANFSGATFLNGSDVVSMSDTTGLVVGSTLKVNGVSQGDVAEVMSSTSVRLTSASALTASGTLVTVDVDAGVSPSSISGYLNTSLLTPDVGSEQNADLPNHYENVIAAGRSHSVGISSSGSLYAWGSGFKGESGSLTVTSVPTAITGGAVAQMTGAEFNRVAAGEMHALARTTTGTLIGWGSNESGQLGTSLSKVKLKGTGLATQSTDLLRVNTIEGVTRGMRIASIAGVPQTSPDLTVLEVVESNLLRLSTEVEVDPVGTPLTVRVRDTGTGTTVDLNVKAFPVYFPVYASSNAASRYVKVDSVSGLRASGGGYEVTVAGKDVNGVEIISGTTVERIISAIESKQFTTAGSATAGTVNVSVTSAAGVLPGMTVSGGGIPVGTAVTAVVGDRLTLSKPVSTLIASGTQLSVATSGPALLLGTIHSQPAGDTDYELQYGKQSLQDTVVFSGSVTSTGGPYSLLVTGSYDSLKTGWFVSGNGVPEGTVITAKAGPGATAGSGTVMVSNSILYTGTLAQWTSAPAFTADPVLVNVSQLESAKVSGTFSSGSNYNFLRASDGSFFSWGANRNGSQGDGTTNARLLPSRLNIDQTAIQQIRAGAGHSLGLDADSQLWVWGDNSYGQLGTGTRRNALLPTVHTGVADYVLRAVNISESEAQQQVLARLLINDTLIMETLLTVGPSTADYASPDAPLITRQPSSVIIPVNGTATLSVVANSIWPIRYQWMRNGVPLTQGANSPTLVIVDSRQNPASGLYSVEVANEKASVKSTTVQVTAVATPQVISQPIPTLAMPKALTSLSVLMESQVKVMFDSPRGLAVSGAGDLLIADRNNSVLRQMNAGNFVETMVGVPGKSGWLDSIGSLARFSRPDGLSVVQVGEFDLTFVADSGSNTVRYVWSEFDVASASFFKNVRTLSGLPMQTGLVNGPARETKLNAPSGVSAFVSPTALPNQFEVYVYIADANNHGVRLAILPVTIVDVVGQTDPRAQRKLRFDPSVTLSPLGSVDGVSGEADGVGNAASFFLPTDVVVRPETGGLSHAVYVVDSGNQSIRRVEVNPPASNPLTSSVVLQKGSSVVSWVSGSAQPVWIRPGMIVSSDVGVFSNPTYVASVSANGMVLSQPALLSDIQSTSGIQKTVTFRPTLANSTFEVFTYAGTPRISGLVDGAGSQARFWFPQKAAINASGELFVSDVNNRVIRKVTPSSTDPRVGLVRVFAGVGGKSGSQDGPALAAQFTSPKGVTVSDSGVVYVSDDYLNVIRRIKDGEVTTVAGILGTAGYMDSSELAEYTYQWKKNGSNYGLPIAGEAGRTLTLNGLSSDSGVYTVDVTSNAISGFKFGSLPAQVFVPSEANIDFVESLSVYAGSELTVDLAKVVSEKLTQFEVATLHLERIDSRGAAWPDWLTLPPEPIDFLNASLLLSPDENQPSQTVIVNVRVMDSGGVMKRGYLQLSVQSTRVGVDFTPIISRQPESWISTQSTPLSESLQATVVPGQDYTTSYQWYQKQKQVGSAAGSYQSGLSQNLMFRFRPSLETMGIAHAVPVNGGTGSSLNLAGIPEAGIYSLKVTNTPVAAGGTSSVSSTFSIESDVVQVIASGDPQIIQHPLSYVGKAGDRVESLNVYPKTSGKSLFNEPRGIAYDFINQSLLVVEAGNYSVRRILMGGEVSTIAGSASEWGGEDAALAMESRFGRSAGGPDGLAVDGLGNIYVADTLNHTIRKIAANGRVSTIAGGASTPGKVDGLASASRFNMPSGIACRVVDASTTVLYVADSANHAIRKIQISSGSASVTTLAGGNGSGYVNGSAADARFFEPLDVAYANGIVYVADFQNHAIRAVTDSATPTVITLAGMGRVIDQSPSGENLIFGKEAAGTALDGVVDQGVSGFSDGTEGTFRFPTGVATDGVNVYVADWGNHLVRKVSLSGDVSTIAGEPGVSGDASAEGIKGNSAHFNQPTRVAVDALGNVFVSDASNHVVRKIAPNTTVNSVAGVDGLPGFLNNDRPVEFYYQWVKGDRIIEGAKTASYVIPELNSASEGVYGVFVSTDPNMNRAIFSALATVRVCAPNGLPSVDVVAGQSAIINRDALVAPLAESAAVALPIWARLDTTGRYLVVSPPVDEPLGTIRTSYDGKGFIVNIVSKLNSGSSGAPLILAQPSSKLAIDGSSGQQTFSAVVRIPGLAANSPARPTAFWSKLGGGTFAATSNQQTVPTDFRVDLDLASLNAAAAGFYRLHFTWSGQSVETDLAQLVVTVGPQILTHPQPVTFIDDGSSIGLSVEARTAVRSLFMHPTGLAYVAERGSLLVADSEGHVVRSISKGGTVTKWVGNPEQPGSALGTGAVALFTQPTAVAYDPGSSIVLTGVTKNAGSTTLFANYQDGLSNGLVSASGTIQSFSVDPSDPYRVRINLDVPADATVAIEDSQTVAFKRPAMVYVADSYKHLVRRVSLDGVVEEFCGSGVSGPAAVSVALQAATFNAPSGIAVDPVDGTVYITDGGNHALRRIRYGSGVVETIAGSVSGKFGFKDVQDARVESGTAALMYSPSGVAVRTSVFTPANGLSRTVREVFVSDSMNHAVRLVRINISQTSDVADSVESVTTWAGYPGASGSADGLGGDALFFLPSGLALSSQNGPAGELFVADSGNHTIRRIIGELDAQGNYKNVGLVNTVAGVAGQSGSADGSAQSNRLSWPKGLAWNSGNNELYIADTGNFTVRVLSGDVLGTLAGQAGGAGTSTSSEISEFSYQWYKGSLPLTASDGFDGYQSPTLTKRISSSGDDGAYWVRIRSMDGSFADSKVAEVRKKTSVNFLSQPSELLAQKSAQGLIAGGTWIPQSSGVGGIAGVLQMAPRGSFSLLAQLSDPQYLTYSWYRNGEKLADGQRLSGATVSGADSSELKFEGAGWRNVVAAVAGAKHSIAIVADGDVHSVYAWGANDSGQLGLGDRNDRLKPTLIPSGAFGARKIVEVAVGDNFSLARTSDGSLFAWGSNSDGQLGNNLVSTEVTPRGVDIGTLKVTQLAAGNFHALAVDESGRVISWGLNTSGQLGRNTPLPWKPDAIESDQRVLAVGTAQGIATIAAGGEHSLFISAGGSLYAFGANARGQCGTSASTVKVEQAVLVSFGTLQPGSLASVTAGSIHSAALSAAGSLYSWGGNNKNQLGSSVFKKLANTAGFGSSTITVENVEGLNAASSFVYAENGAGGFSFDAFDPGTSVSSVSSNTLTLSSATKQSLLEKEMVLFAERTDVAAVDSPRLVNSEPVNDRVFSLTPVQLADVLRTHGQAARVQFRCDGVPISGAAGSLSVGTFRVSAAATSGGSSLTVSSTLGLSRGMNVWGTGIKDGTVINAIGAGTLVLSEATSGSIPSSTTINFGTLAGLSELRVASVDTKTYDLAVVRAGEQQPAILIPASTISPAIFRSMVAGGSTNFALTTSNQVLAWGVNEQGQFGLGSTKSLAGPQRIGALAGISFVNFSTRGDHTFALSRSGQLYAWGSNSRGQLGDGTRQVTLLPSLSAFTDLGDYRLNVYSSIDGTQLSSSPVRIAEPSVSTPKFQPLPGGLTQLQRQVSFGGAATLSIAQPTGYPTPTAFWFDAANPTTPVASGNSYQVTSVVGRKEFIIRLGYGTLSSPAIDPNAESLRYIVEAFALTAPRIELDLGGGFKRGMTSASVVAGHPNVKLKAVLDTAAVGVSYQWRRDGSVLHGETSQTLDLSQGGMIRPRQAGVYRVSVSDGINVRLSADLKITVNGTVNSAADLFTVSVDSDDLAALLLVPNPEPFGTGSLASGIDSEPKLPAGTALKLTGIPNPGTQLIAWSVTSLDRSREYARVAGFGLTATYVTPAADIVITPIFGSGYQGSYAGLISSEDIFIVDEPDLNKIRGYFTAAVTNRGEVSGRLRVDGELQSFRSTLDWTLGPDLGMSVSDSANGLMVQWIQENGPADLAGLKVGAFVDGIKMSDSSPEGSTLFRTDFENQLNRGYQRDAIVSLRIRGVENMIRITPNADWFLQGALLISTRSGRWMGNLVLKTDSKGTQLQMRVSNVTLKNARFGGAPVVGNDLFAIGASSVGVNPSQRYPVYTAAAAKGRTSNATLGQGGVFKVIPGATGVAMFAGVVGNGTKITFSGPIGRLYAPESADGFLEPMSFGYNNEIQDIFSEITDVPKAAMVEMLRRKRINPNLPIYIPGNLRADLNGIVGTVIFGNGEIEGSIGMINRKGLTSEIEYTPNLLIGSTLSAAVISTGTAAGVGAPQSTVNTVRGYTASSYPKATGLATWTVQDFVSTRPVFSRPAAGYLSPTTVARLTFTPAGDGLIEGSFVSTDKLSLEKSKTGLLNKVYAVMLDGNIKAGVGFILRGSVQSMAKAIGNLQDASDTTTEVFRLETID